MSEPHRPFPPTLARSGGRACVRVSFGRAYAIPPLPGAGARGRSTCARAQVKSLILDDMLATGRACKLRSFELPKVCQVVVLPPPPLSSSLPPISPLYEILAWNLQGVNRQHGRRGGGIDKGRSDPVFPRPRAEYRPRTLRARAARVSAGHRLRDGGQRAGPGACRDAGRKAASAPCVRTTQRRAPRRR